MNKKNDKSTDKKFQLSRYKDKDKDQNKDNLKRNDKKSTSVKVQEVILVESSPEEPPPKKERKRQKSLSKSDKMDKVTVVEDTPNSSKKTKAKIPLNQYYKEKGISYKTVLSGSIKTLSRSNSKTLIIKHINDPPPGYSHEELKDYAIKNAYSSDNEDFDLDMEHSPIPIPFNEYRDLITKKLTDSQEQKKLEKENKRHEEILNKLQEKEDRIRKEKREKRIELGIENPDDIAITATATPKNGNSIVCATSVSGEMDDDFDDSLLIQQTQQFEDEWIRNNSNDKLPSKSKTNQNSGLSTPLIKTKSMPTRESSAKNCKVIRETPKSVSSSNLRSRMTERIPNKKLFDNSYNNDIEWSNDNDSNTDEFDEESDEILSQIELSSILSSTTEGVRNEINSVKL